MKNKYLNYVMQTSISLTVGMVVYNITDLKIISILISLIGVIPNFNYWTVTDKPNLKNLKYTNIILDEIKLRIGKSLYGTNEDIFIKLDKDASSILIAGQKGSGKSSLLRSVLLPLYTSKLNIEFHLIDFKGVELGLFKKHKKSKRYANDNAGANKILKKVLEDIRRRNKLFEELEILDIEEYNQLKEKKANYICLVIEEIIMMDKENTKLLEQIICIGRSAGNLNIVVTQRPESKTFSSLIKANFDYIVGLKTLDNINSRVIGIEGLETIKEKGRGILKSDELTEFQSYYLSSEEVRECLRQAN